MWLRCWVSAGAGRRSLQLQGAVHALPHHAAPREFRGLCVGGACRHACMCRRNAYCVCSAGGLLSVAQWAGAWARQSGPWVACAFCRAVLCMLLLMLLGRSCQHQCCWVCILDTSVDFLPPSRGCVYACLHAFRAAPCCFVEGPSCTVFAVGSQPACLRVLGVVQLALYVCCLLYQWWAACFWSPMRVLSLPSCGVCLY